MWVRFVLDHDHHTPMITLAYRAGFTGRVHGACAAKAIELGAAETFRTPPADEVEGPPGRRRLRVICHGDERA